MTKYSTKNTNSSLLNQRRFSLNRRVLTLVASAFLFLIGYFLINDYFSTITYGKQLTLQQLQGIVNNLSTQIDGHLHQQLTNKFKEKDGIYHKDQDQSYQIIHDLLAKAHQSHDLSTPIYTFIKTGDQADELAFIATSSVDPYFLHPYTTFPSSVYNTLDQGGKINLYKDEFGSWLSAFAPIYDQDKKVVAYVQADQRFDDFIAGVRTSLLQNAIISILGFILVMFLLFPHLKRILLEEEKAKIALQKSLEETRRLSQKLEENELTLKKNALQLEQSNKDLTEFAHIASHDLKAPIRNMQAFAQLIKRQNKDQMNESTQEYLEFIIQGSRQAQRLISGLLSYSTADKDLGKQEEVSMNQVIEMAVHNLNTIIEERNAKVLFEKMCCIKANPILIAQVLQNLINNGIKYNQTNQPIITIGTGRDEQNGLYFFVHDNGIGIPQKYQADIFKMFKRLHTEGQYEGSGIGLAFCNRVVASYGGKMWLSSTEGTGSTFYFTLPNAILISQEEEQPVASLSNTAVFNH